MSSGADNADYTAIADRIYIEGWALALTFAAVDQWLAGSRISAVVCAILSALCQFAFIRWTAWLKNHPDNRLLRSLSNVSTNAGWWIGTLMVFLAYLALSPYFEDGRWPFPHRQAVINGAIPSADEIATAVVKLIPKTLDNNALVQAQKERDQAIGNLAAITADRNKFRDQLAALPKPPPYVNPLHNEFSKWNFVSFLRHTIANNNNLSTDCRVTVNSTPIPYAQDFAGDFEEIMKALGWKYEPRIATSPVDKEITVRAVETLKSRECADAFAQAIRGYTRDKNGKPLGNDPHRWIREEDAPDYLKNCPFGCVSIDFGTEDNR